MTDPHVPWWRLSPIEMGKRIAEHIMAIAQEKQRRWGEVQALTWLFQRHSLEHRNDISVRRHVREYLSWVVDDDNEWHPTLPLVHNAITTAASRLLTELPQARIKGAGVPLSQQPQIEDMSAALSGVLSQRQARLELYDMGMAGLICGRGYCYPKINPWGQFELVRVEYNQVLWSYREGRVAGRRSPPRTLFFWELVSRGAILHQLQQLNGKTLAKGARMPGGLTQAVNLVKGAPVPPEAPPGLERWHLHRDHRMMTDELADMVMVGHAWHLPSGPGSDDGKHAVILLHPPATGGGVQVNQTPTDVGTTLLVEPYDCPRHEIVAWSPFRSQYDWDGFGFAHLVMDPQVVLDRLAERVERTSKQAGDIKWWMMSPLHEQDKRALAVQGISVFGGTPLDQGDPRPPVPLSPLPVNRDDLLLIEQFLGPWSLQLAGINPGAAQGATILSANASGAALREEDAKQDTRLSPVSNELRGMVNGVAQCVLDKLERAHAQGRDVELFDRRNDDLKPMDWSKIRMTDTKRYAVQVEEASALPEQRSARIQWAFEQRDRGAITETEFIEVIMLAGADIRAVKRSSTAAMRMAQHFLQIAADPRQDESRMFPPAEMDWPLAQEMTLAAIRDAYTQEEPGEVVDRLTRLMGLLRSGQARQAAAVQAEQTTTLEGASLPAAPLPPEGGADAAIAGLVGGGAQEALPEVDPGLLADVAAVPG